MKLSFRKIFNILFFCAVLGIVFYIYYYVIGSIIDLNALHGMDGDVIREYLRGYGFLGMTILALMQALQMIVVVIPAEFVQISAALAYPIWIMVPVCVAGVVIGATAIYFLTNFLHFKMDYLEKRVGKIKSFIADINNGTSMSVIMYILFIMPVIPFGAICYFASSSKIKYSRYITVCATGVLPSVLTSFMVGNIMNRFLGRGTWQFVIAVFITVLAALLLLYFLLDLVRARYMSHHKYPKPNYLFYHFMYFFVQLVARFRSPLTIDRKAIKGVHGPALVIAPHTSFFDFAYIGMLLYPRRVTFVINSYFYSRFPLRLLFSLLHPIPKKLFSPDVNTIRSLYAAKRNNEIICLFPEGRLTTDGKSFFPASGTAELLKRLSVDVYCAVCDGAYLVKPKWSRLRRRGPVAVTSRLLFTGEQLASMPLESINELLGQAIVHNEDESIGDKQYVCSNMTQGLDGILYRCPGCKREFTLKSEGGRISCGCGFCATLDGNYRLHNAPFERISQWYDDQKRHLQSELSETVLQAKVHIVAITENRRTECGLGFCRLDCEQFSLESDAVSFTLPTASIEALPFSVKEEFELYYHNTLYYLFPMENPAQCTKWSLFVDLCREQRIAAGGQD